jgi:formylglycine-generating enzyme required for sulfatase activity
MSVFTRREWIRSAGASFATCALGPRFLSPAFATAAGRFTIPSDPVRMIAIPAGSFLMGTTTLDIHTLADLYGYDVSWMDGEVPQRHVFLPAYAIQKYPVTNAEFALFCAATGYPPRVHWPGGIPPEDLLDHPVTWVNRADAQAYADWVGLRLPTEAEWEKAARGVYGRRFPWGKVFDPLACQWNSDPSTGGPGTAPVTAHPSGASPYGVEDMAGNVGEWCADGPSPSTAFIKGGAWTSGEVLNLRPAARNMSGADSNQSEFYGFRCARSLA